MGIEHLYARLNVKIYLKKIEITIAFRVLIKNEGKNKEMVWIY